MPTGIDDWAFEQIEIALWDELEKCAMTALAAARLLDQQKRDDRMAELITMLVELLKQIERVKSNGNSFHEKRL